MGGDGCTRGVSDCVDDHGVVLPTRGGLTTGVLAEIVGSDGS
jgi:hypothetical protein